MDESTSRVRRRAQSDLPVEWCRGEFYHPVRFPDGDGLAHCTCHPNTKERCCRCGTTDFDRPNPAAGRSAFDARRAAR